MDERTLKKSRVLIIMILNFPTFIYGAGAKAASEWVNRFAFE